MSEALPYLDGARIAELMPPAAAVSVLERRLVDHSIDPERDSPRLFSPLPAGEFLLMPTQAIGYAGVKVVTIAPANPAAGHPKIQGVYSLFEAEHLTPLAVMDAAELTLVRTPATTALAVKHMVAADPRGPTRPARVVVVGTGPQAERHIVALAAVIDVAEIVVVGRRAEAAKSLATRCRERGIEVCTGSSRDLPGADVIVCVTSSATPVLDDELVSADAVVCAVGCPRSGPPRGPGRADVARRRGRGEPRLGHARGRQPHPCPQHRGVGADPLTNLAELVAGRLQRRLGHPCLYSGVGMAWQDIAIAIHLYTAHTEALTGAAAPSLQSS